LFILTGVQFPPRVARVLVIEDDTSIGRVIEGVLADDGLESALAGSAEKGFFLLFAQSFDLLILDRMLPDRDGLDVLRALRQRGLTLPVLMLTARDATMERVEGLEAGADDYLPKPFELPELVARVRALLRRSQGSLAQRLEVADLVVDVASRTASRAGRVLGLTAREFDLLEYLARHRSQVVSRPMLARDVWKEPFRRSSHNAVIDVHMARLRKKVDEGSPTKLIRTVRGVGYIVD
jgi:two-component system copper resistance phosphate regulon response regulator CusR